MVFNLANSVWYRQGFTLLPDFLSATRTYFDATVQGLDFSTPTAAPTINRWVSNATQGKIPTIVPDPIPPDEVAYLINAIYFKGSWTTQFDKNRTGPAAFHLRNGSATTVPTMSRGDEVHVGYHFDGGIGVIDLPYGGKAFSMTIVLPRDAGGIDSLVPALTSERWSAWTAALDAASGGTLGDVYLPKFVVTYGLSMNRRAERARHAVGVRLRRSVGFHADGDGVPWSSASRRVRHEASVDVNVRGDRSHGSDVGWG